MPADDSFDDVMARLAAGDQEAAARVFHRFARRLVSLAGARLGARLRQKVDPEDVLQSVYRSFFQRHAEGEFAFTGWDSLWALLTVMTVRKCNRWRARFHTGKRDVTAEVSALEGTGAGLTALARDPTPEEVVLLGEMVDGLLRGLGERDRGVVTLALQGYTPAEIGAETGVPERTVYRILERVRQQLRIADGDDASAVNPPTH
jgi:RNA polymerase sigma-70 factor (ECF subfamily)